MLAPAKGSAGDRGGLRRLQSTFACIVTSGPRDSPDRGWRGVEGGSSDRCLPDFILERIFSRAETKWVVAGDLEFRPPDGSLVFVL